MLVSPVKVFLASVGVALVVTAGLAVPIASADECTVTATLLDGTTLTFTVSAPPGTPPIDMLPPGTPPVQSVTADCQATTNPAAPPSGATPVTAVSQNTTTHTTTTPTTHTKATSTTHTKATTTTGASSPNDTTADHKTKTVRSGPTRPARSRGQGAKTTKRTAAAHLTTRTKRQHHRADRKGSTHRPHRGSRRSAQPHRPRDRPAAPPAAKPQGTATVADPAVREAALAPAHQPSASSIPIWVLLLAGLALTALGVGAANEAGLLRRRL